MLLLLQVFGIFQNDIITNVNNNQNPRRFEKVLLAEIKSKISFNKSIKWEIRF